MPRTESGRRGKPLPCGGRSRSGIWCCPNRRSRSPYSSTLMNAAGCGSSSIASTRLPAGLKMVSRDSVWRAVYDKVPPPPPHQFRGADRITIHEDADGDGSFERHKVFVDGLNIATAVERGRGGVCAESSVSPFYPDANSDDVPDADPRFAWLASDSRTRTASRTRFGGVLMAGSTAPKAAP